ncbi:MAG: hypothetical protein JNM80_03830 [Phycisphaerae bacterium]|nr:hypothetical protein [Phycisphaerae bacterium]
MRAALSPYHLTTREPAAMATLLLAEEVVTLLPRPASTAGGARSEAEAAAARVPAFEGLLRAWEWSMPLWRAGVLVPDADGDGALSEARAAAQEIESQARFAPLRRLLRPGLFEDGDAFLRAICSDVMRTGPDPALGVPVQAGLDRLASRHGLVSVRSDRATVVQRAEHRLGTRLGAFAAPILVRGGAARALSARERLADSLGALRRAIEALAMGEAGSADELAGASRGYAGAFESAWPEVSRVAPEEERAVAGTAAVTLVRAPADVSLVASLEAAGSGITGGASEAGGPTGTVVLMVVRMIGRGGR